jgi:hypothetical protein
MAGYLDDISQFTNAYGVGAVATPSIMGGAGASNPVGAYLQSASTGIGNTASTTSPVSNGLSKLGSSSFGLNLDTANLVLGGLQSIGNIWAAWEANKLAKKQFNFQKDITETNLANQIQAYNTTLEDRIRSRAAVEGMSDADAQAYIDKNSLRRR